MHFIIILKQFTFEVTANKRTSIIKKNINKANGDKKNLLMVGKSLAAVSRNFKFSLLSQVVTCHKT